MSCIRCTQMSDIVSGSDGFDFWRGELLCTSSWNRFACSVAASSQLWAYFDLITGNLPLRPWSRLVRGWKYKQLVVKAAMAASLAPPTGKHQPSQGWTSAGASVKTVLFWFSTSTLFPWKRKTMTIEKRSKNTIFHGLETLIVLSYFAGGTN